ncbi:MAG TPA: response regulator, partial [Candidatus Hydrogenedentes bacterium]|nr:response regulator [Candidatus Hydrogenedentota bacterium]
MKSILFVDDEPNVLDGLRRMLFPMQREWEMAFARSGAQALEQLEARHFDVVVTDMRMPGMDGSRLLAEVKKRHPDTLRFVLSGQSDSETLYRSVGEAHQFLSKPCKPALLKECVDRAFALRELLSSD